MKKLAILSTMLLLTGCGLVVHGKRQDLKINTDPSGLTAIAAGRSCVTPCALNVPRKSETLKIIKKDGSEFTSELDKTFNFWSVIVGNVWNMIWPGLIVDTVSGGAFTLEDIDIKFPQEAAIRNP